MKVIRSWLGYQAKITHVICLDCDKETCNGSCDRYEKELRKYRKESGEKKLRTIKPQCYTRGSK